MAAEPPPPPAAPAADEPPAVDEAPAEAAPLASVVIEAPAPAAAERPASVSPARKALVDFYAFTENNWSVQGYSSVDQMREALGNSQTGWLKQTEAQARAEESAPSEDQQ